MEKILGSVDKIGYFAQVLPCDVEALQKGMDGLEEPMCNQKGVFRVNCIDSLDRTNVVQSLIARKILEKQMIKFGIFKNDTETIYNYPDFLYIYKNCKYKYTSVLIFMNYLEFSEYFLNIF